MNQRLKSLSLTALAAALLAGSLAGCAPLIIGGAAVGTALVATDRRTSGAQLDDEAIELRSVARLTEALGDRAHVNVTSYNRQVLLTGEVPSETARQHAEAIVAKVENVMGVVNELAVMPATSLTQRSADTLITGKVRASLVDASDLQANAFKVVTERGVVYLMGRVTPREAERGTQIARQVSGVLKVVRIFEIIDPASLPGQPAAQPATVAPSVPGPQAAPAVESAAPQGGAVVTPVR